MYAHSHVVVEFGGGFQIEQDPRLIGLRKRVSHESGAGRGCQFRPNAVIVKRHGVVAGRGDFGVVAEPRAITLIGIVFRARVEFSARPPLASPADRP